MDQDLDNRAMPSASAVTLCRKSWTAYVGIALRALILFGLGGAVIYWQPLYWEIMTLILLVGFAFVAYQVWYLRSYRLYYDDIGVWAFSGILPWKRGVSGVKWRDLDEAVFHNSFWSWISGSYTIQLKHRFTKESEIVASDMANGKQVVITINQKHQQQMRLSTPGASLLQ